MKSKENKNKGVISGFLNDSFFHETSKQFIGKSILIKPPGLNSRISHGDDF